MVMKYIISPVATEKAIKMMESENKLVFIVERKATKSDVKRELEREFGIKPVKINVYIDPKGRKKAIVKLPKDKPAIEFATEFGVV